MQSFSANMLNAVAKLIAVYQDQMDDESFKEKLGAVSLKSLIRTAKERRPALLPRNLRPYRSCPLASYQARKY